MSDILINSSDLMTTLDEQLKHDSKLDINIESMYKWQDLPNVTAAIDAVINAINTNKHIRIVGDYDVDGICATYILVMALRHAGAKNIDYRIPNRVTDGYGINTNIIDEAINAGVQFIITCDNGITACDEIEHATKHGIDVVITDHHEPDSLMPLCSAIVDPKIPISTMEFKEICGATVAFKLLVGLYEKLNIPREDLHFYLQFVALATVCDVMPMVDVNVTYVSVGIDILNTTQHYGLKALCKIMNKYGTLTTNDIGFVIGPCLNAASRMNHLEYALNLMFANSEEEANHYADLLKDNNVVRKELTDVATRKAEALLNTGQYDNDKVLVLELENTLHSILGIVAANIKELTGKPTIVLTEVDGKLSGSGRSIACYDMHEALSKAKSVLNGFGGHKSAVGLELEIADLGPLRKKLNADAADIVFVEDVPEYDFEISFPQISMSLVSDLLSNEPINVLKQRYVFKTSNVTPVSFSLVGKNHNVCKMQFMDNGALLSAVMFSKAVKFADLAASGAMFDIYYTLGINNYNGMTLLQLTINDYRVHK